jgi:two-component system NarL family sensor kinase
LGVLARTSAIEVVAPLIAGGQPLGFLALGKRWDEEIFDDRDLDIIELVAQEAALFILTARQVEALREVPQQITAAQERERFRIAQELHDTVQQFLGRLPFYLEVALKQTRANPTETELILKRTVNEVEAAAQTVRQIRTNLAPFQLETSLLTPLQTLISNFESRSGLVVQATYDPNLDSLLDLDSRHALYRVIQQGLDNINAYAKATQVKIDLTADDHHLNFLVTDNGQGIAPDQLKQAEIRGSFGLRSMRARITSLGGEFIFESSPATGTTLSGWLPLN